MRVPLVVVTGVDREAMDAAMVGLAWDLPEAVSVRHHIDPESQVLTRVVSDVTGVLEQVEMTLEHACVTCALREDVVPTLERLARTGRWRTVVCCLPSAAEADQLVAMVAHERRLARALSLSSVVAALSGDHAVGDLLGDELLADHGLHVDPHDRRGLGEVACAIVERADVVVLDRRSSRDDRDLLLALARPDAVLVEGPEHVGPDTVAGRHRYAHSQAWCSTPLECTLPHHHLGRAWRLDLTSSRAFHPQRLLDQIDRLGAGSHRSRGAFWLPTRPDAVLQWGGAGGQLSIGSLEAWGRRTPRTRLLLTGLGARPRDLGVAFDDLLLTEAEAAHDWRVGIDGFEPWLGAIEHAA